VQLLKIFYENDSKRFRQFDSALKILSLFWNSFFGPSFPEIIIVPTKPTAKTFALVSENNLFVLIA
jgi:hypothetical protein